MNIFTVRSGRRKSDPEEYRDARCKHLEEWRHQSESAREKSLGQNAFNEAESLYSLQGPSGESPTFRPRVQIPEIQKILLEDSNRISDVTPQVYVFGPNDKLDENREKGLQAFWQTMRVNYHLLYATLTSRLVGTGFLQLCYSPDLRNGKGGLWVKSRDPRTVGIDPTCDYDFDPSYLYFDDWLHVEEVRKRWPLTSQYIKIGGTGGTSQSLQVSGTGYGFQMPEGPMTVGMTGMPGSASIRSNTTQDTRVRVSHYFCKDYTREMVEMKDLPEGSLVDPEFKWKYPNGRYLVECKGYILSDGSNPFPHRTDIPSPVFPLFPVWALPPLYGPWGIPITRFALTLQNLSEKLYTQLYENVVRLNNGTWFIDSNTGIDIESFGGMPGEVQQINPNSRIPVMVKPDALGAQATALPDSLMKIARSLLAQTDAKQGNPGSGNVSSALFDSSILQSSGLLQLAGRLQSFTISQLASAIFYTAGRYLNKFSLPFRGEKGTELASWDGILNPHDYDLMLDEDTIQPLSEVALRRMVPELMKTGILTTQRGLQILGIPHAEKIAQEQKENLELQALARVKGAKGVK